MALRTTQLRVAIDGLATSQSGSSRTIAVLLLLSILLACALLSTLEALVRPFWHDEIFTVVLCRLPTVSETWRALENAADTQPPLYYLVARAARFFIPDDHLAYRLPSILGLLGTVLCIYLILSRRLDRLSALIGAAFVLSTVLASFGAEARPYALMVCCVAGAVLAWQRVDDSRAYSLVLTVILATAVSLHYYAILVLPAFILGEAAVWLFDRRFRVHVWVSLFLSAAPLLFFAELLLSLNRYYGQNFWARPSGTRFFTAPNVLFGFGSYWGFSLAVGVTVCFLYWSLSKATESSVSADRKAKQNEVPTGEWALALGLLWLPGIAVVAAKITRGGMTDRYMLPAVVGCALAVGYCCSKVPSTARALLLLLVLTNYGLGSLAYVSTVQFSLLEPRATAAREIKTILDRCSEGDLPIVISSGLDYLPMVYYKSGDVSRALYVLTDPQAAVRFTGTDSVDLGLLALGRYFDAQIEEYDSFVYEHEEFFLVSRGTAYDWLPERLTHDGHTLILLSITGKIQVYKVIVKSRDPLPISVPGLD